MKISSVSSKDFKKSNWSGGSTTEFFIYPEGSSYQERKFKIRISSAQILDDHSNFTSLEGVKRYITPLTNEVNLKINGETKKLQPYDITSFSGEDEVESFGKCRDFNLMLKNTDGKMCCIRGKNRLDIIGPNIVAVYCYEGKATLDFKEDTHDFTDKNRMIIIDIEKDEQESIDISSDSNVLVLSSTK